jgi:hypothetical protein
MTNMRKLIDWAMDGDNLDAAVDRILKKIESGELSIHDLPTIPLCFLTAPHPIPAIDQD